MFKSLEEIDKAMDNVDACIRTNVALKVDDLFTYDEEGLKELVIEKVFGKFKNDICDVLVEVHGVVSCDIYEDTVTLNFAIQCDFWA